jgi:hypothetical protein
MAREKYRLDPLARARQAHVERASRSLGEASRAKAAAEQLRKRIEEDALRAESEAKRIRTEEHADAAQVRAADLEAYDLWEIRAQNERADREHRLDVAKASESKEALRERAARAEVEKRQAAAQVVERDRERWKQREAQRVEATQEAEANEVWRKPST